MDIKEPVSHCDQMKTSGTDRCEDVSSGEEFDDDMWCDEVEDNSDIDGSTADTSSRNAGDGKSLSGKQRQLQLLSEELGLDKYKQEMDRAQKKVQAQQKPRKEVEVVVFQSHKRKQKTEKVVKLMLWFSH